MKKDKLTKEAQTLDNKIKELAKTTTRKLKQVRSESSYQFHGNAIKQKPPVKKDRNGYL